MRFRNSALALFFMFTCSGLHAQPFDQMTNALAFNSGFLSDQYHQVYSVSPAMLNLWDYSSWSNIAASHDYASGEFRNPQKFSRQARLNFQTESVHSLENTNWTFYGLFHYANGQADSVRANLSYRLPTNGSPYYMLIQRFGMWKEQKYEFNVIAANQLTDRFGIGLRILYEGDLNFRYNDTRNNQTSLYTDLALTASYRIGQHTASAGAESKRRKTEYSLTNKYPFDSQGQMYNVYHTTGLGSYIRNVNARLTFMNESWNAIAQWLFQSDRHQMSLAYKLDFGNEFVINQSITAVDLENRIMDYHYTAHRILASSMHHFSDTYLATYLTIELTDGLGKQYNEIAASYLENYTAELSHIHLKSNWYRPDCLLSIIGLEFSLQSEDKFDRNFGYRFDYTNAGGGLNAEFSRMFGNTRLSIGAGGHYHLNLDHTHNPNAATNNIYTYWVAEPLMGFLATDYIRIPAHLEFQISLQGNLVQIRLEAEQLLPIEINYPVNPGFTTDDNYLFINSSIKFYF